jgi:uncharacterized membrane protein YgcG
MAHLRPLQFYRKAVVGPILGLLALLAVAGAALAQDATGDFGASEPGRWVYDRTGLLTPEEVAAIERAAAATTAAGAPTVVYLQAEDADRDETEQDARALMDAWGVGSAPGTDDGLVVLLNLDPDDLRDGEIWIEGGTAHTEGGNLPPSELARILDDAVLPELRDDRTAAGIVAGLDQVANSLQFSPPPPPPPSAFERWSRDFARIPLNLIAGVLGAGLALFAAKRWQSRPSAAPALPPTTVPPGDLSPAVAGALIVGSVGPAQAEGTLLDLAGRGALVIEPQPGTDPSDRKPKVRIRLLDRSPVRDAPEAAVWDALAGLADRDGAVGPKALGKLSGRWGPFRSTVRQDLVARGWFDPSAGARRRPFYIAGTVALVAALAAMVPAIAGEEPLGLIAIVGLGLLAATLFLLGAGYPTQTAEGLRAAAPWRAYQAGLKAAGKGDVRPLDLDQALPYLAALGVTKTLDRQLKAAGAAGTVPLAFRRSLGPETSAAGFYPYWIAFHAGVSPSSASGGSSSSSASTGSSGAGGGF